MNAQRKVVLASSLAACALAGGSIAAFGDSPTAPQPQQPAASLGAVDQTPDGVQASGTAASMSSATGTGSAERAVLAKQTNHRRVWTSKTAEGVCVTQMPTGAIGPGGTCYTKKQVASGDAWQVTGSAGTGFALMAVVPAKVSRVDITFADGTSSAVEPSPDGLVFAESQVNVKSYAFAVGSKSKTVEASGFEG